MSLNIKDTDMKAPANAVTLNRVEMVSTAMWNAPLAIVARHPTTCSSCNLRGLCLPCGLSGVDAQSVDDLGFSHRRLKRSETLYRAGAPFKSLYAVRSGFFKSYAIAEDGREQITGFQMAGEIIGLDGIETDAHHLNVEALEDSVVCVIPFTRLEQLASRLPGLQRQLHRMMSREIVHDQGVMMLLGSMDAEERVAAFLLNLSQRFAARGYAAAEFLLRMTREEIGSYLGLKLETVSRIFSKLQLAGLIAIEKKSVRLLDVAALKAVLGRAA
jgi:CRP/FNR family transcriptional regulator